MADIRHVVGEALERLWCGEGNGVSPLLPGGAFAKLLWRRLSGVVIQILRGLGQHFLLLTNGIFHMLRDSYAKRHLFSSEPAPLGNR
ncbi:MAG: hypothetical protein LBS59_00770 [Puniceicoccales bacterium]|jgi:hypothetical protein|nr:hypothetical protein [Puniceicoccales bacterium]